MRAGGSWVSRVPLSENEKQILAEIENALATTDPRLAGRLRAGAASRWSVCRQMGSTLLCVLGLTALVAGLWLRSTFVGGFPVLSVLGYLVMWWGAAGLITESVVWRALRRVRRGWRRLVTDRTPL